jgi:Tol biopolymer transport system component/DNA-binding winged helix-turn-helix (wHTH) protein
MAGGLTRFRLNGRLVDTSLNRITLNGDTAQVEPKIMQVLVTLASRPTEVVSRDELMAAVWPEVFVTDDVLNRAIRELRRMFGDHPDDPRVIETIRKRGYRLIAPIEPVTNAPPADRVGWTPGPRGIAAMLIVGLGSVAAILWVGLARHGSLATEARMRFVPLTSEAGNEVDPALTADGGRLAYVARGSDGRAHVFTKPVGGTAVQLLREEASELTPTWSPDGTQLAFARITASGCTIQIALVATAAGRTVGPCGNRHETKMSWSPDGRSLAIASGEGTPVSPLQIELLDLTTGYRRVLTKPPVGQIGDAAPAFSPDGRRVAFVRTVSGSVSDVFTADAESGALQQVTFDNADIIGVDWEPDGTHLVFSSDRAGGYTLWRISVTGGAPSLLAGGGAKLKQPAVARQGGLIAYESWQYEINIVDMPTTGNTAEADLTRISPTTEQWNFHPQLSPEGTRVVFQSTRSGQYELWLADRAGANPAQLTSSSAYKSMPRWSPDGRHLAFVSRTHGKSEVDVLDVESRAVRALVEDEGGAVAPSWSRDGRAVYFGSHRGGSWQVWKVYLAGGALEAVTADGGYAAIESPDGGTIYFTRLDRRGLWRRPAAGGPAELVTDAVQPEDWRSWGLIDRGIYFLERPDEGDPVLMILDARQRVPVILDARQRVPVILDARPRALARLPGYAWSGLSVSADGSHVLYPHTERRDANIVSIEFGGRP